MLWAAGCGAAGLRAAGLVMHQALFGELVLLPLLLLLGMADAFMRTPPLIVFDLDNCLWAPEMFELREVPTQESRVMGKITPTGEEGCIGVRSGHHVIRLYDDARTILRDYYLGTGFLPETRLAAASSADTPLAVSIGRAAMGLIEILPSVTMRDVFAKGWPAGFESNLQIGRSPPLSSDKAATHFPILQAATKTAYADMIFFDDCNWGGELRRESLATASSQLPFPLPLTLCPSPLLPSLISNYPSLPPSLPHRSRRGSIACSWRGGAKDAARLDSARVSDVLAWLERKSRRPGEGGDCSTRVMRTWTLH